METRDILLKADRIVLVLERTADEKIRALARSWDDARVTSPNQVLEVAVIGKQVALVRVDKPLAYLDIDDTGAWWKRVTARPRIDVTRHSVMA
jgi:hypothetical protein